MKWGHSEWISFIFPHFVYFLIPFSFHCFFSLVNLPFPFLSVFFLLLSIRWNPQSGLDSHFIILMLCMLLMPVRYKFFGNSINRCDVRHLLLVLIPSFSVDWVERKNRNLFVFYVTLEKGNSRGFTFGGFGYFFSFYFSNMFTLLDLRAISIENGCAIVSFAFKLEQSDEHNDWKRNQTNGEKRIHLKLVSGRISHQNVDTCHVTYKIEEDEEETSEKKNRKIRVWHLTSEHVNHGP